MARATPRCASVRRRPARRAGAALFASRRLKREKGLASPATASECTATQNRKLHGSQCPQRISSSSSSTGKDETFFLLLINCLLRVIRYVNSLLIHLTGAAAPGAQYEQSGNPRTRVLDFKWIRRAARCLCAARSKKEKRR